MLVLSRQVGEVVIIGEGESAVRLQVVDIRGDKVRLGFDAPKSIKIHREEIYDKIHETEQEEMKTILTN